MENEKPNETPVLEEEEPLLQEQTPEPTPEEKLIDTIFGEGTEQEAPAEEQAPVEEEPKPEEAPQEENEELNLLEQSISIVLSATPEQIEALPQNYRDALQDFFRKKVDEEVARSLSWQKAAIERLYEILRKNLDENEEFRVLSKTTLQKNVQVLEDQVKFNQYNKILKSLCTIYSTYAFILDTEISDPKLRSNIEGLFEELDIVLEEYGVEKVTAKVGDEFDPVISKIAKRIPTSDPNLDKKVAAFKAPGFRKGKVIFSYIRADMYVYEAPSAE